MNRDRIEGLAKQLSGTALELWSRLRGDDAGVIAARRTRHAGCIQMRHGNSQAEIDRQLSDFLRRNRDWDISRRSIRP